ncbi:MAG: potassium channel family protein [Sedimentisphaerales bacterium]|jgi:hypothetical protein
MIELIENIRLRYFGLVFVIIVLIFALFYWQLCPSNGITDGVSLNTSFGNAVYFSIVTISSLGYGDFRPIGWSRPLAAIEVIIGLSLMGIMIAKLTSSRLSYHVRRLFASDAQNRFDSYVIELEKLQARLHSLSAEISKAFEETPKKKKKDTSRTVMLSKFREHIDDFRKIATAIKNYIGYEINKGDFFADVPQDALVRTAEAIDQLLFVFSQIVISMTTNAKLALLTSEHRKIIAESLESFIDTDKDVQENSKNLELQNIFKKIHTSCVTVQNSYFSTPEVAVNQPDQVIPAQSQPQG